MGFCVIARGVPGLQLHVYPYIRLMSNERIPVDFSLSLGLGEAPVESLLFPAHLS